MPEAAGISFSATLPILFMPPQMTNIRTPVNTRPPVSTGTFHVYSMVLMAELACTMLPMPKEHIRHRKL